MSDKILGTIAVEPAIRGTSEVAAFVSGNADVQTTAGTIDTPASVTGEVELNT